MADEKIATKKQFTFRGKSVEELKKLNSVVNPHEKLLVISGDIGQAAKTQAKCQQTGETSGFAQKTKGFFHQ